MEKDNNLLKLLETTKIGHLTSAVIQEILIKVKNKNQDAYNMGLWTDICDILWNHMMVGLIRFDDQLLCSTCFYTVLSLTNKQEFYLDKILTLIKNEAANRLNKSKDSAKNTSLTVSLMYGLFQSTFLVQDSTINIPNVHKVLSHIVELLISMAYDYSKYTFLVFKTINAFGKVLGLIFQQTVFCEYNLMKLLNLTNHNWENPITGVRDLNKLVFKTLVGLLNESLYISVLEEINSFEWNKAKYLMLAEIIEQHKTTIVVFTQENKLTEGVLYSLQKPGLVSSGADMYFSILKNLKSEDEWCELFLKGSISILSSLNKKAIENFGNYWCLTTFKRFPQLLEIIVQELTTYRQSNLQMYSILFVLKQGNKLGLLNNKQSNSIYEETKNCVLKGLEHRDPHVRMLSFEIIAITQGKSMPNTDDCNLIINYLKNNINSDCTVLRISMLNSFKCFITKVSEALQTSSKHNNDNDAVVFYRKLQELIVQSLNLHGNYQRKIATIKLCHLCLTAITSNDQRKQQKGKKLSTRSLVSLLRENNCLLLLEGDFIMLLFKLLKDPADDIRENIVELLLDHYSSHFTPVLINHLIDDAINSIQSKFFYEISCGQSIFRLLASLFLKETFMDTTFKSVDDIFSFAHCELYKEFSKNRNIVKTIEAGKQLHSLLGVIFEILKISKHNAYKIKSAQEKISDIIEMLNVISNQFMWEVDTSTSSDFSKINEMIQNMIISSGYNPMDEEDATKISGLQQIVLNCLWFNVKASCDLAAFLLQLLDNNQIEECEKCLTILMHVLETSRHKGVIEAAGAALGRSIQYLTSLPEDSAFSNIPLSMLQCKLQELISYANMASVTRRGAGLSIMVHRIVSSDMKKGKPLFHYFMETILETCNNAKETAENNEGDQKDLPKAIYIHFLTRIVIDSSLASDMMYYSAELAEIAFKNLISSHWQIRNAALQLYGALIPKLIGQKKASGTDDETIATVACDEFRTHSPKLWKHITECLRNVNARDDIIQAHSNAMPIVNVLANLAKRYNFSFDTTGTQCGQDLLNSLIILLGSPIFTVRRLSAKCIYNIYEFETIYETFMYKDIKCENELHGYLSLLIICHKNYILHEKHKQHFADIFKRCSLLLKGSHSYICKQQFEELVTINHSLTEIQETLAEAKHNKHSPGVFHWAISRFRRFVQCCQCNDIPAVLETLLLEQNFDEHCKLLFDEKCTQNIPPSVLESITTILYKVLSTNKNSIIWKILYEFSLKNEFNASLCPSSVFECLKDYTISYRIRYAIPFLASLAGQLPNNCLDKLSNIIFGLCDPETSDVDMRCIAALANNKIGRAFYKIRSSNIKIAAIKSAVILLQDEDEDVRLVTTDFYKHLSKNDFSFHPCICLCKLLEKKFLNNILDVPSVEIKVLCNELEIILSSYTKTNLDQYNPFSSESKNIYFEIEVVNQYLQNLKNEF